MESPFSIRENKKGHQQLMAELDNIKNIIYVFVEKPDSTKAEAKATSEKVNDLIRNWFIGHIVKSDMKMKGLMNNAG